MSIEAMKQALEALEEAKTYTSCESFSPSMTRDCEKAIIAIKQALAQPEQEPVAYCDIHHLPEPCVQCAKEHEGYNIPPQPKEPEQEPVAHPFEDKAVISSLSWAAGLIEQAYRECGGHNGADSWLMNYADKQGERIRQADHREWEKVNGRWRVKATPPQRKPLTDEKIKDGYNEVEWTHAPAAHWFEAGVKFSEAAHGIKE